MSFYRLDICEAWYVFLSETHEGQGSEKYARLSRLLRHFFPKDRLSAETLSEGARAIYDRLINPPREMVIGDPEEFEPCTVSGGRNILILDPLTPSVYLFRHVGAGIPMTVHNRTELALDRVPSHVAPDSLVEWLQSRTDDLLALADRYQGEHWDGSNYVGRWTVGWDGAPPELGLDEAIQTGTVATYWDAADYLEPVRIELVDELLDGTALDAIVSREVAAGDSKGCRLRADDVHEYLVSELCDTPVCACDPTSEDYDEGDIVELCEDGRVLVSWESGVRTPHSLSELRRA